MAATCRPRPWQLLLLCCCMLGQHRMIAAQPPKAVCGATTQSPRWRLWGTTALFMQVDTAVCGLSVPPVYIASVYVGSKDGKAHVVSSANIFKRRADSFVVVVTHAVYSGSALWRAANVGKWKLGWLALTGQHAGVQKKGKWTAARHPHMRHLVFTDVDTRAAGLSGASTPVYFSCLSGKRGHGSLTGGHMVHAPSAAGFRVYIYSFRMAQAGW